jgi:hypothetical protein
MSLPQHTETRLSLATLHQKHKPNRVDMAVASDTTGCTLHFSPCALQVWITQYPFMVIR